MKTYLAIHRRTSHHNDLLSVLYHLTYSVVLFRIFPEKPFGTQNKNLPQSENIKHLRCLQHQNHLRYLDHQWNMIRTVVTAHLLRDGKILLNIFAGTYAEILPRYEVCRRCNHMGWVVRSQGWLSKAAGVKQ